MFLLELKKQLGKGKGEVRVTFGFGIELLFPTSINRAMYSAS